MKAPILLYYGRTKSHEFWQSENFDDKPFFSVLIVRYDQNDPNDWRLLSFPVSFCRNSGTLEDLTAQKICGYPLRLDRSARWQKTSRHGMELVPCLGATSGTRNAVRCRHHQEPSMPQISLDRLLRRGSRGKLDLDVLIAKTDPWGFPVPKAQKPKTQKPKAQKPASRAQRRAQVGPWEVRLEFVGGTSAKFWKLLEVGSREVEVSWGRIGRAGDAQVVSLDEAAKRFKEKLKKGYELHSTRGAVPAIVRSLLGV